MKQMIIGLICAFMPAVAVAGKVSNLDKEPRTLTIQHTGGAKETVEIEGWGTHLLYGHGLTLSTGTSTLEQVDGEDDYIIQKGKLYIQRRRDISQGH